MGSLIVFILVVAATGWLGSRFMPDAWHAALRKPAWNPPDWVFGPVWSVLYLMIAVSGWLVWRVADGAWNLALTLWVVQLAINACWSWLFFGRHRIAGALVDTVSLLFVIVAYMVVAYPLRPLAAALFVPYALWVGFAMSLNFSIWRLNPGNTPA